MSLTAAVIRELVAAGLSGETLVAACERIEGAHPKALTGAERSARWRERQAAMRNESDDATSRVTNVTQGSPPLSPPSMVSPITPSLTTPSDLPLSNSSTVAVATRRPRDEFEEFWQAYPRREGANPRKPAKAVFVAKLKAGATAEEIVSGAKACAIRDRANIGTPFIPQAVKWLRDERWKDYAAGPPAPAAAATGWRPGLPTSAELRAKYAKAEHDQGTRDPVEQATSVDEGELRLRGGSGQLVRGAEGQRGAQKLGEVLRANGLGAVGIPGSVEGDARRGEARVDGAVPVAGVAHDRH